MILQIDGQLYRATDAGEVADAFKGVKTRCRDCGSVLTDAEVLEMGGTQTPAFGLCSACKVIATQVHPCGNCGTVKVRPGRTHCPACLAKAKG